MNEGDKLFFREQQKFSPLLRWFVYITMGLAVLLCFFALKKEFSGQSPPDTQEIILAVLVGAGVPIGISVIFVLLKMETEVRPDGLYIRYFPFHIHFKKFPPDDILECHARQYKPIREYGGWGIRCGFAGKGKAYNVSGDKGVQLVFKNGKRLLIGSQRAEELEKAIRWIKGYK